MKVRLKILVPLCLLALAAWYFWPRASRPLAVQSPAPAPVVVAGSPVAPPVVATNAPVAEDSGKLSASATNRLALRLANTPKSVKELSVDRRAILLENAFIDTSLKMDLKIPTQLKADAEPGAYIVQARGPVDAAYRAAVSAAGGQITPSYIPNNAFLVLISAGGAATLAADPHIQSVLPWEPYYKVQSSILGLAVNQKPLPAGTYLTLGLFTATAAATEAELNRLGAQIMSRDRSPFGPIVRVRPPSDWLALAKLPGVQIVEPVYLRKLANDQTRVALGVSTNTTDLATNNYLGLSGVNVMVEVNDTGIDSTHPDFGTNGTAASPSPPFPSRVFFDSPASTNDTDGHGTHVAGIIAGNGSMSINPFNVGSHARGSVTNADFRGKAPQATLFAVGGINGGHESFVSDSYLQEAPALTNALISNNSWGFGDADYDLGAASYDAAVRDAIPERPGPQPVLFVFAAGNDGGGSDSGTGGFNDSISSPGTAKNVITVGALEQLRNITNIVTTLDGSSNAIWTALTGSATAVAGYSSRGNVGIQTEGTFGRFKPDVVAPGTFTVSTRSQMWDEYAYYNPTNYHENLVGEFLDTNTFGFGFITVPQNAVGVIIQVEPNALSPNPFPTQYPIYISSSGIPDPSDPSTYDYFKGNTNFVSIPPDGVPGVIDIPTLRNGGFAYTIGITNRTKPMNFNVREIVITTNDLGNELIILSNLNNSISGDPDSNKKPHYYRYESGTSMATPAVSGVLALMQDFFVNNVKQRNLNYTTNPSPALLKALLINGARLTDNYKFAVTNTINLEGWGEVKLPNSIPISLTNAGPSATNNSMFFVDQSPTNVLATGDRRTYMVSIPSLAARSRPLRVTLAWTDPPGNPAAAIKLVNDLDLVVTNLDNPNHPVYFGNNFSSLGSPPFSAPGISNSIADNINNVENVYLSPTLGTNYSVTVIAHAVNVNAVTLEQTNIVQDYALVISCGDGSNTNGITVTQLATPPTITASSPFDHLVATNGIYFDQLAGANSPWLTTNDLAFGTNSPYATNAIFEIGQSNQWHFYAITNTSGFTNAAFIIFLPNTAAIPREGVFAGTDINSTRPEADLDLFVASPLTDSAAASLPALNPIVVSNCLFSQFGDQSALGRGGSEFIAYSNSALNQVYYIGVRCADQMAARYAFVPIFSQVPFSTTDSHGNTYVTGVNVPVNIPDGDNRHPGVGYVIGLSLSQAEVKRVIVTNTFTHENFGDLVGTLTHSGTFTTLNNHDGLGPVLPSQQFIYDDSGQGDVIGAVHSDGPGALQNFRGTQGAGLWLLTEIDDSFSQTGMVTSFQMKIEPHRDLTHQPFTVVSVPAHSFFYDFIDVSAGYTNLLVVATNLAPTSVPPIQLFVKDGDLPTLLDSNSVALTNCVLGTYPTGINPGNSISVGPPLAPGRYFVGLYNPDNVSHDVLLGAFLSFNSSAITVINDHPTEPIGLLDDAVTTDTIFVSNPDTIQFFNVGLRIDHPRISDLAITLIAPDSSRYLLMENRGAQSTNGCGSTVVTTNQFSGSAAGGAAGATNFFDLQETSGTIPISWNFYTVPDQMDVYYQNNLIFTTGLVSGSGSTNITFGPGLSTQIKVVMDQSFHPARTLWDYIIGGVITNYTYLTFTEDTNLTTTPIKFAPPPFIPAPAGVVYTDNFDTDIAQPYATGTSFGSWTVVTNQVNITTDPPANSLPNLLALNNGAVSNTLPTVAGRSYLLSYNLGTSFSDTNSPVTNANWHLVSRTFTATGTGGTPLVLDASGNGFAVNTLVTNTFTTNALFDDFSLTQLPLDLFYQPEQSLAPIIGTPANGTGNNGDIGTWQLEILDNRTGAGLTNVLLSWNLQFTFANTNFTIPTNNLNDVETNTIGPGALKWFEVDVPTNALAQTNTLIFANLPLNIWFSTNRPPTTNSPSFEEQTNSTGGSVTVFPTSVPPMIPGSTNYVGVQNPNAFAATFAITVNFQFPPVTNGTGGPFAFTLPATGVTGTNAQLNGFATPNATNSGAWFQWGATTNYGNSTPTINVGNGFGVVYVTNAITNLIFAQVYHSRLVVSNVFGTKFGADVQFAPGIPIAWGTNTFGQTNIPAGVSNVVALAGGLAHSMALLNNGTVVAWGDNSAGQTNVPTGLTNVAAIAAGGNNSLALLKDGTVVEWGDNIAGQDFPEDFEGDNLTNVVMVSAGWSNSIALLSDGTVEVWGDGHRFQLSVPFGLSNVVSVAAGGNDVMALLNDGTVVSWGDFSTGQRNVPASLTNVVAIAEGDGSHSLALSNYTVVAWGTPVAGSFPVPPTLTNFVMAISAGLNNSLVLLDNGHVFAWGDNTSGQTNIPPGLTSAFAVASGARHDLALMPEPVPLPPFASTLPATSVSGTTAQLNGFATPNNSGGALAWFQWGPTTNYPFQTPPVVLTGGYNVIFVTNTITGLINNHTYRAQLVVSNSTGITYGFEQLLVAGYTVAWGDNTYGQSSPPLNLSNVVTIAAGGNHSLEALTNGLALGWGQNNAGQTNVPPGLTNVVQVAAGFAFSTALLSNGVVVAWGAGSFGETNVPPNSNLVQVASEYVTSIALQNNGVPLGWGQNIYGGLSNNVPAGLSNVVQVAIGDEHSMALLNDGTVVAWSAKNTSGQATVPPGLKNVVAIAAGSQHSLALQSNGVVVAWGDGSVGQTNIPAGLSNVVAIAAGSYHNMALRDNGQVVSWGYDSLGQTNVPVGLSNVVAVTAGLAHSMVLVSPFDINANVFPSTNNVPLTNVVAPGGINWFEIDVPTNAIAATNILLFATLPVNFWWSTNVPPSVTTPNDVELLTGQLSGSAVLYTNTPKPLITQGGIYYLGVQNPNSVPVTNALEVIFAFAPEPPKLGFIPVQLITGGDTLIVTNTGTTIYTNHSLGYTVTNAYLFIVTFPPGPPPTDYPTINPTNGIITWVTATNDPFSVSIVTTIATDVNNNLTATNNFFVVVIPSFPIQQPVTNSAASNSITWIPIRVPVNAVEATNALVSSTSPVNLWYSTNLPPSITTTNDYELLTNSVNGTNILNLSNTIPVLLPGGFYFLGIENTNSIGVTNVIKVSFRYKLVPPVLPIIPDQVVAGGDTLTVTNTATDTNAGAILVYNLTNNSPVGAVIDTNGIITWATPTNIAPTNVVITTIVNDPNTGLSATNSFHVFVLPSLVNGNPDTNVVGAGSIEWHLVKVPINADQATNRLLFATAPVNLWYSSQVPPTVTNATDFEMLTGVTSGSYVMTTNVPPLLVPGSTYFLGVQNLNAFGVTNAVEVDFHLVGPTSFIISNIVQATNALGTNGFLLTWYAPTNTQFHLQWTRSLTPVTWTNFKGVISFTSYQSAISSQFQYFDDGSQTGGFDPTRFYRLQLLNSPTNTEPEFELTQTNYTADPLVEFVVTNHARDYDIPAQSIAYFVTNSLPGTNYATVTNNGVIHWTPDVSQSGLTNFITTIVVDGGTPTKRATNTIVVVVSGSPMPMFGNVILGPTGPVMQWTGPTSEVFNVRWTPDLTPPISWTTFPDMITSTNGQFNFTDTNTPLFIKFYQLILLP